MLRRRSRSGSTAGLDDSFHAFGCVGRRFVFPHHHSHPSEFFETGDRVGVATDIAVQLPTPPVRIVLRFSRMLGAAVPEAAAHVDRNAWSGEGDVDPASGHEPGDMNSIAEPASPEFTTQIDLGYGVSIGLAPHPLTDIGSRRVRTRRWRLVPGVCGRSGALVGGRRTCHTLRLASRATSSER